MKELFILCLLLSQLTIVARTATARSLSFSTRQLIISGDLFYKSHPIKDGQWLRNSDIVDALMEINKHPDLVDEANMLIQEEHQLDLSVPLGQLLDIQRTHEALSVIRKFNSVKISGKHLADLAELVE